MKTEVRNRMSDGEKANGASSATANGNDTFKNNSELKTKYYNKELARLHAELVKLQQWVVHKGIGASEAFTGVASAVSPLITSVQASSCPLHRSFCARYKPAGDMVSVYCRLDGSTPRSRGA